MKGVTDNHASPFVKLKTVNYSDVKWEDGFWKDKFQLINKSSLPSMWQLFRDPSKLHAWQNFEIAAGSKKGKFRGTYWVDGDFYKCIEATCYVFSMTKDEHWGQILDEAIDLISRAQQPDGYIHTPIIIGAGYFTEYDRDYYFEGIERWSSILHHELYCMGHLFTSGCIHFRLTGKEQLLKVAIKCADYLYDHFILGKEDLLNFGFNPSQIMGLVELYRTTKNEKYLKLAQVFLKNRGARPAKRYQYKTVEDLPFVIGGTDFTQDRTPFIDEKEAKGHAVTGTYLWCGAADIFAETGEEAILKRLKYLWDDVVNRKMYITGGTGAVHRGITNSGDFAQEMFGFPFELPNSTAYNETCANISNVMWGWRMLSITGDAKYTDIMERVMYNNGLSGLSIDGCHYFYTNPMSQYHHSHQQIWDYKERQEYIPCFCCPPSIARAIASWQNYLYTISKDALWINHYGNNFLSTILSNEPVKIDMKSNYPWDGKIILTFKEMPVGKFSVYLRIPSWVSNCKVNVNGKETVENITRGSYFKIERYWHKDDTVEINMLMDVQFIITSVRLIYRS